MRITVVVVSLIVSGSLTYSMYLFTDNFVHLVDLTLDRFFQIRFGYWSLQHIVFGLTIGTIPLISVVAWLIRGHKSATSIFLYNLIAGCLITLFVLTTAAWLILVSPNKGIFNTIKQPHVDFWNYVLIGSSFLTSLIFILFSIQTRSKQRLKNEIAATQREIDQ